ncbi:MAG: LysR family transcriptional regulator [Lautropia sp.]
MKADARRAGRPAAVAGAGAGLGGLSLGQLRAFVAVAESSSFSAAGERLHLTPSAISVLIKTLESRLGATLFNRRARRFGITALGAELLPHVRRVLADLQHALALVEQTLARDRGRVVVATTPWLAAGLVPDSLAGFRRAMPGIELDLLDIPAERLASSVIDGDADVAIGTLEAPRAELETIELHRDALMLAVPPGHRLARVRQATWRSLRDERLVELTPGSGIRALTRQTLASIGLAPAAGPQVNQVSTALALVAAGLGVAVLPAFTLRDAEPARCVVLPLARPRVERAICAIVHRLREPTPAAAALLAHVERDLPPRLRPRT